MNATSAPTAAPVPGAWPMLRAMVGLGLLCGLLIVTVYETTRPRILRNRAEALERAVLRVLPEATTHAAFVLTADGSFKELDHASDEEAIHAGFDSHGRLVGLAVPGAGMGYQDVIRVLYGYSPNAEAIVGLQVLESRETPGLGDRIETDPDFRANFRDLNVRIDSATGRLARTITAVKHGTKTQPWEVDGITGATISSDAIADLLDESANRWLPLIRSRVADFQRTEEP